MALGAPVAYPVEAHTNCAGPALFDCVIDDSTHNGIVGHYQCGWLLVPHLLEGQLQFFSLPGVYKQCPYLCFGHICHDIAEYLTYQMDWSIGGY
eukprot:3337150-Ditylum_brightwellii.AAC.1